MRFPSGLNAALWTMPVWPVSGWPIGWPDSASHTLTVLSSLPETMPPVGAKRQTLHRETVVPHLDLLAGGGVPHLDRLVRAA